MRQMLALLIAIAVAGAVGAQEISTDRAEALLKAGKWGEARELFEQLVPTLAGDRLAEAWNRIGYSFERDRNQLDAAIGAHRQALAVPGASDQTKAYAWLRIGYCLKARKEYVESIEAFAAIDGLVEVPPGLRAEALLYRAWSENSNGELEAAAKSFTRVVSLEGAPGSLVTTGWHNLGALAEKAARYEEALAAYQKVVDGTGATSHQRGHARSQMAEIRMLMQGNLPFYINPYVTAVTGTSARISWVSQGEAPGGAVTVEGIADAIESTNSALKGTTCQRHVAEVAGLAPGRVYRYTVTTGGQSVKGSFKTSPPAGTPVTFAVLGDTQSEPELHRAVAGAIAGDRPDVVLHVGDLTDRGSVWGRWRAELFEPGWAYLQQAVFAPAVGNHDGGPYYPRLFDAMSDYYYAFEYGDVCVAVLDSYWGGQSKSGRPKQLAWLDSVLGSTKAGWKIVSLHVPMVATSAENDWFGREDFLPLLEKHGVDLVVCGHHPMYRRYLPIGEPGRKPVLHITTGGGGPVGEPAPSPLMVQGAGLCHHSLITVDGNRLELVAKQPDGTVIDRFTLLKENGRYQEETMAQAVPAETAFRVRALYQELLTPDTYDLLAGLEAAPEPGQPCRFAIDFDKLARGGLDLDRLPEGTALVVAAKAGSAWEMSEQELPLSGRRLEFTATAPGDFAAGAGVFSPPLEVVLNVAVKGRRLVPWPARVRLHRDAQAVLDRAGLGLPSSWEFRLDPDDRGLAEGWSAPEAPGDWQSLQVTAVWEDQGYADYDGIGWYRTRFTPPAVKAGHRLWIEFGAIDESCWIYLNGKEIGSQIFDAAKDDLAWQKPRRFDLTEALQAGENVLAVRVQDLFGMGGIHRGVMLYQAPANLAADGFGAPPAGWTGERGQALVLLDNGRYAAEPALKIDVRAAGEVRLSRRLVEQAPAGTWRVVWRYRTQGATGEAARFTVGGATVSLAAHNGTEWAQAETAVTLATGGPLEGEIAADQPGVLWLTELRIER